MNEYKIENVDGTGTLILKYPGTYITENGHGWQKYLEYLAGGGQVDPWKTSEELMGEALTSKLQELRAEKNSRVDAAVGSSDPRRKDKIVARSVKLLRRETKGTATTQEKAELDALEAIDDFLDALEGQHDAAKDWLEDAARTLEEIQGCDVVTDPGWSELPA